MPSSDSRLSLGVSSKKLELEAGQSMRSIGSSPKAALSKQNGPSFRGTITTQMSSGSILAYGSSSKSLRQPSETEILQEKTNNNEEEEEQDPESDNTQSLLNQVHQMTLELLELRSIEAMYKTKVDDLSRSRDQNEKMEKRLFEMLKNNKALKAELFEKSKEINDLKQKLHKVGEELKFERTYRTGIQKNKLRVEHEMVDIKHKMKVINEQSEETKQDLHRKQKEIVQERSQRLLELHYAKVAGDEKEEMLVELNRMRGIATETVELERRFLEQIKPLHCALDAGTELAEYYAERELQLDLARRVAEGNVRIEQETQKQLRQEIAKLTAEKHEAVKTLGEIQKKFASFATSASSKNMMVSAPPSHGKAKANAHTKNGAPNTGIDPNDPLAASWDTNLGATRVLEQLGLVNLTSLRVSTLRKHDAEIPRYMSSTTGSLLRNGATFVPIESRGSRGGTSRQQDQCRDVSDQQRVEVVVQDQPNAELVAQDLQRSEQVVQDLQRSEQVVQDLQRSEQVVQDQQSSEQVVQDLQRSEQVVQDQQCTTCVGRDNEKIVFEEGIKKIMGNVHPNDVPDALQSFKKPTSHCDDPQPQIKNNETEIDRSGRLSDCDSLLRSETQRSTRISVANSRGARYVGRGLGMRRCSAIPAAESVVGQGTAKQVVQQIRRKIQQEEEMKRKKRIEAREQESESEESDHSETESSDSDGSSSSSDDS